LKHFLCVANWKSS